MLSNMLWEKTLKMRVTDDDIRYSEKILLPNDVSFNEQRKEFIKNLDTIDLQAVPGSGKTMALLAKLLILEKHLPFKDGSGILVISHTNAAINEIKRRIENYCPRLFKYPSFVGTIQSFVDKFLAIPFYTNLYKRKPFRIDDEIYKERIYTPHDAWVWLNNHPYQKEKILYKSPLDENEEFNINLTKNTKTYKALLKMKQELMNKGVLCFADAYILAMKYLKKYPLIKHLLQSRFRYVFVDEMQDMDKHQYDILENIFFDEGNSKSIYQRIGDKNQAIFSEEVSLENFWNSKSRDVLNIDGSCRFSKEIADVVTCFALNNQNIEGKSIHKSIKPHLLIYTDNTIKNVLLKFIEIIKTKQDNSEIPNNIEKNIKAIGWRKKSAGKNKITIKNYFPEFNETTRHSRIDYFVLKDYLFGINKNDKRGNSFREIRKNILNSFLKVLRYEKIYDCNERCYTKKRLLNFLAEQHKDLYQEIKLKLFLWCKDIFKGKSEVVFEELREYLPKFLNTVYGRDKISEITDIFINSDNSSTPGSTVEKFLVSTHNNIYQNDDLDVEVGTIHSIKGETHSATLYMETFYQGKYESQRLKKFFKGNFVKGNEKTYDKQSLKMAYVGMSRPEYLLCVAVHHDHVKDYLNEIPDDKWVKVEVK